MNDPMAPAGFPDQAAAALTGQAATGTAAGAGQSPAARAPAAASRGQAAARPADERHYQPPAAAVWALTALYWIAAAGGAFDRWINRITRPVWTVSIPAGKMPARLCAVLTYLITFVLEVTVWGGGVFQIWNPAHVSTAWRGPWHRSWAGIALWIATWWLVIAAAEKLARFRLRPSAPGPTPPISAAAPPGPAAGP